MDTKETKNIWIGVVVIVLIVGAYYFGTSSNKQANLSDSPNSVQEYQSGQQATAQEMQDSCQKIADAQLRNGLFESAAVNFTSGNTKPSVVKDVAHYNATKSVCAFVTVVAEFPNVYSVTDPYETGGLYLYSAALLPDGSLQTPNNNGAVQMVTYANIRSFTYPKPADEIKYFDFNLKQTGIGTNNYSVQTLGVGNIISKEQFKALVSDYMETDADTLINQIQTQ